MGTRRSRTTREPFLPASRRHRATPVPSRRTAASATPVPRRPPPSSVVYDTFEMSRRRGRARGGLLASLSPRVSLHGITLPQQSRVSLSPVRVWFLVRRRCSEPMPAAGASPGRASPRPGSGPATGSSAALATTGAETNFLPALPRPSGNHASPRCSGRGSAVGFVPKYTGSGPMSYPRATASRADSRRWGGSGAQPGWVGRSVTGAWKGSLDTSSAVRAHAGRVAALPRGGEGISAREKLVGLRQGEPEVSHGAGAASRIGAHGEGDCVMPPPAPRRPRVH